MIGSDEMEIAGIDEDCSSDIDGKIW